MLIVSCASGVNMFVTEGQMIIDAWTERWTHIERERERDGQRWRGR